VFKIHLPGTAHCYEIIYFEEQESFDRHESAEVRRIIMERGWATIGSIVIWTENRTCL
jgi:hypothetical protein